MKWPRVKKPAATKGHVLFVSRQRIVGRTNGSSVYLLDLAQAVRDAGFTPHLIQPSPTLMGRWPYMRLQHATHIFATHRIRGVMKLGCLVFSTNPAVLARAIRAVVCRCARRAGVTARWAGDRPAPYAISAPWTQKDRAYIRRHARDATDIVIADYAFQAPAFDEVADAPRAIVMHDLFHARIPDANGRDSVAVLDRETEVALLSKADAVIAIQASERRFIEQHVSAQPILAPMAANPVIHPQPGEAARVLFVGSNTAPNVVGLEWLFEAVWPDLRRQIPNLTLDIVGSVSDAFGKSPPGVVFHGQVNAIEPFYARAGIVISPLTFGSGLKIKLIEGLSQGKALVVTSVTLQGVENECRDVVILADSPRDFMNGIVALMDDTRRLEMATAALAAADQHFSARACHGDFVAWLERHRPITSASVGEAA
ncbi:glycosyltransferase [Novosphingobium sp. Leaf2]|uniref:glycosyltransferase n=1 Tax=Novosphingobium sp. Leaf2 TaxID=1735670 RepID=UPI0006F479CF|nr:glycosyltransferase family 4 protein [Novosphingobium sp. Leaf2]KQM13777.1 hypothetical protein ASE49_11975 [Novosphingobium sp. Leaf2]